MTTAMSPFSCIVWKDRKTWPWYIVAVSAWQGLETKEARVDMNVVRGIRLCNHRMYMGGILENLLYMEYYTWE